MPAPVFRSAGTVVASANSVANPTTLAPGLPATRSTGDVLLAFTFCRSITATVATPSGWTLLSGFPKRSATASGGSWYAFARLVDGSETAPSLAWTGVTTGTTGDSSQAVQLAYGSVNTSGGIGTILDATTTVNDIATALTTVAVPAITTATDSAMIIGLVAKIIDASFVWSPPTSWTERVDSATTTGTGHGMEIAEFVKTPAGTNAATNASPGNTTSARALTVALALKPAPNLPIITVDQPWTTMTPGNNTASLIFRNTGNASLTWSATESVAWASVSPTSGTLAAGASQTLTITGDASAVTDGTSVTGTLTISDTGGTGATAGTAELRYTDLPAPSDALGSSLYGLDPDFWARLTADASDFFDRSDGTASGSVSFGARGALLPSGNTDFITFPHHAMHVLGNRPWSLHFVIEQTTAWPAVDTGLFGKGNPFSGQGWDMMYWPTGGFDSRLGSATNVQNGTITTPPLNQQMQIVMTYDGTTVRMYRDGTANGTATTAVSTADVTSLLILGKNLQSGGALFGTNFRYKDFALFQKTLTPTEVTSLYTAFTTVGGSALTANPADTLSVADAAASTVAQASADTATVADSASAAKGVAQSSADTATVADAARSDFSKVILSAAAGFDIELFDSGLFDAAGGTGDSLGVADSASPAITPGGLTANPSDTATVADAVAKNVAQASADTATVADAPARDIALSGSADTAAVADSQSSQVVQSSADTATVADSSATARGVAQASADTATVADSAAKDVAQASADTAAVADSSSTIKGVSQASADTAAVADSATPAGSGGVSAADSVTTVDATSFDVRPVVADALTLADAAVKTFNTAYADSITVADATALAAALASAADAITVADATAKDFTRALADAATLSDALALASVKTGSDVLVVVDANSFAYASNQSDTAGVADFVSPVSSGVAAAYIHHPPPLSGIDTYVGSGVVVAVVADGNVQVYDASGLLVTVTYAGVSDSAATGGTVLSVDDGGTVDPATASGN